MGQVKSMIKSAVCGPGGDTAAKGSQSGSEAEDSETESQYGQYRPLRDRDRERERRDNIPRSHPMAAMRQPNGTDIRDVRVELNHNHVPHHRCHHHTGLQSSYSHSAGILGAVGAGGGGGGGGLRVR